MIRIALAFVLIASAAQAGPILRVIDGDTYIIAAPWLPPELGKTLSLRVLGIDTPEHGRKAKCPEEAALADKATTAAKAWIATAKTVTVTLRHWDKYGGRVDGTVILDGQSIGDRLIKAGLARRYDGGAKQSWCR